MGLETHRPMLFVATPVGTVIKSESVGKKDLNVIVDMNGGKVVVTPLVQRWPLYGHSGAMY